MSSSDDVSYNSLMADAYEAQLESTTCHLRKYEGEGWITVVKRDPDYVRWVVSTVEYMDEELREALAWAVENLNQ